MVLYALPSLLQCLLVLCLPRAMLCHGTMCAYALGCGACPCVLALWRGAVLVCMQYNKPILCPAIWGYSFKNWAYYRLIIWGYAFLFRVHATILAHLIVQKSPKFKKLAKPCKCWACGLYGAMFLCALFSALCQKKGYKIPS